MNNECGFWYWYYSTYFISFLASFSILVTAVMAFYSFCNKCQSKQVNMDNNEGINVTNTNANATNTDNNGDQEPSKHGFGTTVKYYEMAFFMCLLLLIVTLFLSLISHKYCYNNILQQAFIGSMLVIIGSLSYHIVILTISLNLFWITNKYQEYCTNYVGVMISTCIITQWILMSIVAFLLNCMVQIDDEILNELQLNDDDPNDKYVIINFVEAQLKDSNDDIFILSLIVVFIAIISHFMIWVTICNVFGYRFNVSLSASDVDDNCNTNKSCVTSVDVVKV